MKKKKRKRKRKKKIQTRKVLLPLIVLMILIYTATAIILQFRTQTEISSTLTTCFFTFWSIEVVTLAGITMKKQRKTNYGEEYTANVEKENSDEEN